jgi:Zn-dependent protease with chaperone function
MEMSAGGRSFRRAGLAAVAMLAAAEVAVLLLRPDRSTPAPAAVGEAHYFTPAQIGRGRDYSNGSLWLYGGSLAVELAVLGLLATGRPRVARRALERLGERPVLGGAAAGAALSLTLTLAGLPLGVAGHERSVDFGVSTQSLASWFGDVAKSAGIAAAIAAAGGAILVALIRRFRGRWWIPGTAVVVVVGVVMTWLAPVVIAPLFNNYEALPKSSEVRGEVVALGRRAGVDIGNVYRVDASRRVTSLNAYVDGIGQTKRVVLYDNLIHGADRPELASVVAHELGHVKHDDVPRGLLYLALVAPLGVLFVASFGDALTRRAGMAAWSPAAVPAYALGLTLASLSIGFAANQLSRDVEASADSFALQLTHDPKAFIALQQKLTISNVGNPDPPAVTHFLLGTHPSAVERIGAAIAYRRELRHPNP